MTASKQRNEQFRRSIPSELSLHILAADLGVESTGTRPKLSAGISQHNRPSSAEQLHHQKSVEPVRNVPAFLTLPITLSSKIGLSNNVWDFLGQDKNNVAPRFGFAYEAVSNTVVRGAFGIYYNLLPASYLGGPFNTLSFSGSETFSQPAGSVPAFTMNAPLSATGAFAANPTVTAQHSTVTPYTEGHFC